MLELHISNVEFEAFDERTKCPFGSEFWGRNWECVMSVLRFVRTDEDLALESYNSLNLSGMAS